MMETSENIHGVAALSLITQIQHPRMHNKASLRKP